MKKIKIDENTIYRPMNHLVVENYPPDNNTYSYIRYIYEQYKTRIKKEKNKDIHVVDTKIVFGNPIYFYEVNDEILFLSQMMANCENRLLHLLKDREENNYE